MLPGRYCTASEAILKRTQTAQKRLVLLAWLLFATAILGRYAFGANINLIIEHYGVTRADAGMVNSCYFFAYGLGQVVHGFLCRYYHRRYVLPCLSFGAAGISLVLFFGIPFPFIKYLWALCGFLQAALWPALIRVIGTSIDDEYRGKALFTMGTTVAAGTFCAYLASFLFVRYLSYRFSFLLGAFAMAGAGLAWLLGYRELGDPEELAALRHSKKGSGARKSRLSGTAVASLVLVCFFAVLSNLIKDGLQLWVPNVLTEFFPLPQEFSILLTMALPLLGILGISFALWLHKHLQSFLGIEIICFVLSALAIAGLLRFLTGSLVLALLCFALTALFQSAVNETNTGLVPIYLSHKADPGLLAGIINACCYLGSTGSSYGLGALADSFGWTWVFRLLFYLTLVPIVLGSAFLLRRFIHLKKT